MIYLTDEERYIAETEKLRRKNPRYVRKAGLLSVDDIRDLMLASGKCNRGVDTRFLDQMLKLSEEFGLINTATTIDYGLSGVYNLNRTVIDEYNNSKCIDNIVGGLYWIVEKYRNSIVPICVTESGNESIGTGFYVEGKNGPLILTNRHVVENSIILEIDNKNPEITELRIDDKADLCAISLKISKNCTPFNLAEPLILESVIAAGYPKISISNAPSLLFHKGEINGSVQTYEEPSRDYLVVSCSVAPGNSGGPIIDRAGQVCGMICQSNVGKYDDGISIHHLAVPGQQIRRFLE